MDRRSFRKLMLEKKVALYDDEEKASGGLNDL